MQKMTVSPCAWAQARATQCAVVALPEQCAALAVADDHPAHPELAQHRRRHLAGEGAAPLPVEVLGAEAYDRAAE